MVVWAAARSGQQSLVAQWDVILLPSRSGLFVLVAMSDKVHKQAVVQRCLLQILMHIVLMCLQELRAGSRVIAGLAKPSSGRTELEDFADTAEPSQGPLAAPHLHFPSQQKQWAPLVAVFRRLEMPSVFPSPTFFAPIVDSLVASSLLLASFSPPQPWLGANSS